MACERCDRIKKALEARICRLETTIRERQFHILDNVKHEKAVLEQLLGLFHEEDAD